MSDYYFPISDINYNINNQQNNTILLKSQDKLLFDGYFTDQLENNIDFTNLKVNVPKVGKIQKPFESKTMSMMYKTNHKTKLLDIAQDHLGIQEVTETEYNNLSYTERQNTQMHLIGEYGTINHQWCAHTVSHLSEEAGMDIDGHKKAVQEFIDWANKKGIYRPINTNTINKLNYKSERVKREKQIKEQFKLMKEGDFIIWKTSYIVELTNGKRIEKKSSHIGIIESVNKDGTITVIEGNANESKKGNVERELVKNAAEGVRGNQDIGEFQEVNQRDGLIRKVYTAKDLAAFGYSGYIDTQNIVK